MAVKSLAQSSLRQNPQINSMLAGYQPNAFHHLETVRLGANAASVEFTNLARYSDYQHLQMRYVARSNQGQIYAGFSVRFNNDSGANYAWHCVLGDGANTSSWGVANSTAIETYQWELPGGNVVANAFGAGVYDFLDIFDNTKNKSVKWFGGRGEIADPDSKIVLASGHWRSLSAVNSIRLIPTGNFVSGSRFSLYGIKAKV